jgi:hypothetical protein
VKKYTHVVAAKISHSAYTGKRPEEMRDKRDREIRAVAAKPAD